MKAIYAGTFDPLTLGHLDVIKRSSKLVDELIVLIAVNNHKKQSFSVEDRIKMIKNVTKDMPNVTIDFTEGLVVRYAEKHNAKMMFRGLRNIQDYEYEYSLSRYNANIIPSIETVLLFPTINNHFVSSSAIKELVYHNADISLYIPKENVEIVMKRFSR
ncbi:MAG: pantetheine-phosphate adenylyltransferase [Acholeplasma sp.]|nr:pantetheine-phosphate adenylyltransferase [Acholeplasma sp.]